MDRRGFLAGGISAFFLALFPWLRPKPVLLPIALEELAWAQNYVMWNMVRAYDLRWQIGEHMNILDESLVRTAPVFVQEVRTAVAPVSDTL